MYRSQRVSKLQTEYNNERIVESEFHFVESQLHAEQKKSSQRLYYYTPFSLLCFVVTVLCTLYHLSSFTAAPKCGQNDGVSFMGLMIMPLIVNRYLVCIQPLLCNSFGSAY